MIPLLRKVAQLNIKYRKKWGLQNRCLHWAPPDEVTAQGASFSNGCFFSLQKNSLQTHYYKKLLPIV